MDIQVVVDDNQRDEEIFKVIVNAFKQDDEAKLVKRIKELSDFYISYIAIDKEHDNKIVGHVMVSPMLLNGEKNILALAPVSVLDEYANLGIGTLMINAVLEKAKENTNYKMISVLGSDHYYNRFGFKQYDAKRYKLPFEIENRFFQLLEIVPDSLDVLKGNLDYPTYFFEEN